MINELTFTNLEAACEAAKLLLEEQYVVTLSREEALYILNFEYADVKTVQDVLNTMDEKQKKVLYALVGFEDKYSEVQDG